MFRWFRRNETKNLENAYARKLEEARDVQRRGDIVRYSELMAEADKILQEVEQRSGDTGAQ
ncbi:DUF6435 family protein [Thalassoroseus pseudoceratinae]|uniref:DUF6435 family protein n=1 Tax=Thalassoroseus pseudoceratinae TaxID=2713176 RepID=UPI00142162C2|nr:DUF6435 family protein [Thalassoroseus pseudoceratinae]